MKSITTLIIFLKKTTLIPSLILKTETYYTKIISLVKKVRNTFLKYVTFFPTLAVN